MIETWIVESPILNIVKNSLYVLEWKDSQLSAGKREMRVMCMNNHELILLKMKSAIFDLFSNPMNRRAIEDSFEEFKRHFMQIFEMEFADILLYESNRFVPVRKNVDSPYHTIYAEDQMKAINPLFSVSFISPGHEGSVSADDSLIIRNSELAPLAAILFKASEKWLDFASSPSLKELKSLLGTYFGQEIQMERISEQEKMYRRLFEMAELFNSTMETTVILDGMVKVVSDSCGTNDIQLMLSQEQRGIAEKYRLFDHLNERASAVEAFLSGELTLELDMEIGFNLLNAPIRGRQGIYGILQIMAPLDSEFTQTDKYFIRMITNAAGIALENASLYEQSHRLVNDLQLVNEASRKLNNNLTLDEVISYLKREFLKAFNPDEIAFVFYDDNNKPALSDYSTHFFHEDIGLMIIEPMAEHFLHSKDAVFDGSLSAEVNYYQSRIALPIVNREDMLGFVILLHEEQYYFSFDNFKLLKSLISHSSLAISNIILRDQLQELVDKDNLTKLFTRRYLDEIVVSSIARGESGVFLLMDVDDFKLVNDAFGHKTGDEVLQQISSHILKKVNGKGVASRWGGEEIAIYLSTYTMQEGVEFAQSLIESIPLITDPRVTVSMGLTYCDGKMKDSYNELFQLTDQAMYHAKREGKNQLVINGVTSLRQ